MADIVELSSADIMADLVMLCDDMVQHDICRGNVDRTASRATVC